MTEPKKKLTDYVFPPHPYQEKVSHLGRETCKVCGRNESNNVHTPPDDALTQQELVNKLSGPSDSNWTVEELEGPTDPEPEQDGWIEVGQVQPSGGMISYKRYPLRLIGSHYHDAHCFVIRFNKSEEAIKEYNWDQIEWPWANIIQLRFKDNTPECRAAIKAWRKRHGEDI